MDLVLTPWGSSVRKVVSKFVLPRCLVARWSAESLVLVSLAAEQRARGGRSLARLVSLAAVEAGRGLGLVWLAGQQQASVGGVLARCAQGRERLAIPLPYSPG